MAMTKEYHVIAHPDKVVSGYAKIFEDGEFVKNTDPLFTLVVDEDDKMICVDNIIFDSRVALTRKDRMDALELMIRCYDRACEFRSPEFNSYKLNKISVQTDRMLTTQYHDTYVKGYSDGAEIICLCIRDIDPSADQSDVFIRHRAPVFPGHVDVLLEAFKQCYEAAMFVQKVQAL